MFSCAATGFEPLTLLDLVSAASMDSVTAEAASRFNLLAEGLPQFQEREQSSFAGGQTQAEAN